MKNVLLQSFVAISAFTCLNLPISAQADCDEKCYLVPGTVAMDEKSLYINYNDKLYPVKRIAVDDNGVYVLTREMSDDFLAYCPDGHPNPPWYLVCQVCGKNLY